MSYLTDSAAIFSPSVARIAASTARDWSYVDSWLTSLLPPNTPLPDFERNPETLKALLALASANESADEERSLLTQAEASALNEIRDAAAAESKPVGKVTQKELREGILDALEDELPTEGQTALDALASTSLALTNPYPTPEALGQSLIALQLSIFQTEQMRSRVDVLQRHIDSELASNEAFLKKLQSEDYRPAEDLPKHNLEMQRRVKAAAAQLPELQERAAHLAASVDTSHPTIEDIARQEEEYLDVLARKKELDAQLAVFQGLPSDPDRARAELEDVRRQLRGVTSRRDQVFEGLVEQASPVRRR